MTGATGRVRVQLAAQLVETGHDVRALVVTSVADDPLTAVDVVAAARERLLS